MKSLFRAIAFVFFVYLFLSGIISFLRKESSTLICTDQVTEINGNNDRWHQREWELNDYSASFCATYESVESVSLEVGQRRNKMYPDTYEYENFWGTVYRYLVEDSKSYIDFMVDSLRQIAINEQLKPTAVADLVVTFVQDIPYSYVLSKDCDSRDTGRHPCIGNVSLGVLSPYEFLHSLYGDCDTRSILIYTLLEEMGFDPMIVVSDEYAHAMLALSIPATGDHLTYQGKKYYFWETTGKGWPVGMLPPNSNNVNYWKIALVNEH